MPTYNIPTATVRVVLRTFFLVVIATTSLVADHVLAKLSKIRVFRREGIPVPDALGTPGNLGLLTTALKLRAFPRGRFGFALTAFIFLLNKGADLSTAYFVVSRDVPSRCSFDRGLVVDDNYPDTFSDWNGTPFAVLQTAQRTALNNGCKYGVYKKVNSVVNFCPDDNDTLGTWTCSYVTNNLTYSSGTKNSTIVGDLVSRGLLDEHWQFSSSYRVGTGQFNHMAAWSTNATQDPAGSPWAVRAVIQTDYELGAEMQFDALECAVDAPGAKNTLSSMSSIYNINTWGLVMQGSMYNGADTPAVSNVPDQLAMLLNTMVMVSGGNNNLNSAPAADDDQTQGCLSTGASRRCPRRRHPGGLEALPCRVPPWPQCHRSV